MERSVIGAAALAEALLKELDDLELEAWRILGLRDQWAREAKKWAEEERARRLRMLDVLKRAKDERERRNGVNRKVAELKNSRELLKGNLRRKHEEAKRLKELFLRLKFHVKEPREELARKLEELEWAYQTRSLKMDQERSMVNRIEQVRGKLKVAMEAEELLSKIRVVEDEIRKAKEDIGMVNNEIMKSAEESREHHNKYLELIKEAEGLRGAMKEARRKLLEARSKEYEYHEQYLKIGRKIREVEGRMRELMASERAEKVLRLLKLRRERAEEAHEKLKRGQKVSFEEFKELIERGLI